MNLVWREAGRLNLLPKLLDDSGIAQEGACGIA